MALLVRRRPSGTSLRSGIGFALAVRAIFGKKTVTRALYLMKDRGDRRHDIRQRHTTDARGTGQQGGYGRAVPQA